MKICPKCAHSFAEGFKYCPKDATELVRYDLQSTLQAQEELQFLFVSDSLAARLKNEINAAVAELKCDPRHYLIALLRGESSNRRRRWLLQTGMALGVIAYSFFLSAGLLLGLLSFPGADQSADAAPPLIREPITEVVRLIISTPLEKKETASRKSQGMLGGSLQQRQLQRAGGGGGGGDHVKTSRGVPPVASLNQQLAQPNLDPPKLPNATLIMQPSVYADPKTLLHVSGPIGERNGQNEIPSRGPGPGTGIGPGSGLGYGPGRDGNVGGGLMRLGVGPTNGLGNDVYAAARDLRPTILYKEKAKYTEEARRNQVQGTVVLSVVFGADGRIREIRTIRALPHGLTETAIQAAQLIRFNPAIKDGRPVSVRANLEFNFALY